MNDLFVDVVGALQQLFQSEPSSGVVCNFDAKIKVIYIDFT